MKTPQELLLKAADIMSKRGLAKGSYENDAHQVCAFGALTLAATEGRDANYSEPDIWSEHGALIGRAGELLAFASQGKELDWNQSAFMLVTKINDLPSTSTEDMILSFKRAAGL